MHDLTIGEIKDRVEKLELPSFDLIIGIANGGTVPASLVSYKTGTALRMIKINFRNEDNNPQHEQPVLLDGVEKNFSNFNLLLIDDVSVTGKTLDLAKSILRGNKISTLVFKGKADYVLFPEIDTCVNWPWQIRRKD